jgi:hypothetical protein
VKGKKSGMGTLYNYNNTIAYQGEFNNAAREVLNNEYNYFDKEMLSLELEKNIKSIINRL